MTQRSSKRPVLGVFAIGAATAGVAYVLGVGHEHAAPSLAPRTAELPVGSSTRHIVATHEPATDADRRDRPARRGGPAMRADGPLPPPGARAAHAGAEGVLPPGESLVEALPEPLVELARTTSWDEHASGALERFVVATFDADADGTLSDLERISAVRSLRDAVWPPVPPGRNDSFEGPPDARVQTAGLGATFTLSEQDRRLHHDVDEARRRDRQENVDAARVADDLRAEIVHRFQIEDDGRLTVAEFARYMAHRNAGSATADLNGDLRIDDADLRVFLDVASPIDGP